jgi:putative chitinase
VPNVLALNLARNPAIANHVYANRMGNGPPRKRRRLAHRGFGPFQLTGKDNQEAFGEAVGLTVDQVPDYLRTTNGGAMSMCWFFKVTAWKTWPRRRAAPTKLAPSTAA